MDILKAFTFLGLDLNHPWRLLAAIVSHVTKPMIATGIQDALLHHMNAAARQQLAQDLRQVATDLDAGRVAAAADRVAEMVGAIKF